MYRMMKRFVMIPTLGLLAAATAMAMPQQDAAVGQSGAAVAVGARSTAPAAERLYPQDPGDSLYRAARERLNRDDYRQAVDLFREVRSRYPRSRYAPQALYYQAFALYRIGDEDELRAGLDALRELERSYPESAVAREDRQSLATRIEGALARLGDEESYQEIRERAGGAECDEVKLAALNSLLQMRSEQALPILEKVLANRSGDACSVQMREKAVFLLAQHLNEDRVDVMLDVVRNDPSPEVREKAVFWLSQVPGERTVAALEEIVMQSDDRRLQEKAIFALSQHGSGQAARILRDYAMREDASLELREKAVFWIGQSGSEANAGFLKELFRSTQAPELKEKIIFSVAQMGGQENADWLMEVAADPAHGSEIRQKAIFWAGQSGDVSVEQMAAVYDRMSDRELKEKIIFALSQMRDPAAVDKLMDIVRNEEDPALRKKALFWLGQSGDPRAADFLLEIIEG